MTHLPVADQINHNVLAVLLTVLSGKLECLSYILNTVSVDMEDWSFYRFGNICTVMARSGFVWRCCETNLVVDYDVDRAANFVVLKVLHLQAFKHNTLASERCVTMDKNRNDL